MDGSAIIWVIRNDWFFNDFVRIFVCRFDIFFSNNLIGDTTTLPQFNVVDESISEFLDNVTINLNPNTNEFYLDDKNNSNMINMFFGDNKNTCQYINLNGILEHSRTVINQKQNFYNIPKNIKWKKYYYTFFIKDE